MKRGMTAPGRRWSGLARALGLCAALCAAPAVAQAPGGGARPPAAVTVVTLQPQDVTVTATLPGRVVASGVAEVRPQVDGIITARLFDEGADVRLGEPLYQIGPESYRARLAAAAARVKQAEARVRAAERQAERVQSLIERKVASEQNADDAIAERDTAAAALAVAEADQVAAEIELERTTIGAPLSGVIGLSQTTRGALVTSGQAQPLAVIRALDPVYVDVTQSAAELIAWRRGATAERLSGAEQTVSLRLADGGTYAHTGQLTAAEPFVDALTGVVTLRLSFPNPDRLLLPGMYVQVEVPQAVARGVILAPQQGVSRDARGQPTALVVGADNVVEARVLEVLQARGADWVVTKGLEAGDRLIVEGLQKARPGATVAPEERAAAAPVAAASR